MNRLFSRVNRERNSWNSSSITYAQRFKQRIKGAFENPHESKCEKKIANHLISLCKNAIVLDYGCYDGIETLKYLEMGAQKVYGIDISDKAIERAIEKNLGEKAEFFVGDAHNLPYDANTFDVVVGRAILHHLDIEVALSEVRRVLKPGGVAIFVEPLDGNPLAKLIRFLTPKARTPDEQPLCQSSIKNCDLILNDIGHYYSGFFSSPVGAITSLMGVNCNNIFTRAASYGDDLVAKMPLRYWGRIVYLRFQK